MGKAGVVQTKAADYGSEATTARVERNLSYAMPNQTNLDRNTVGMDRERATFAENTIKYESTLLCISGQVRTMMDAIKATSS